MTITREQVADLQPGDVVELRWDSHPGVNISGPLRPRGGGQWVGPVPVIGPNGEMYDGFTLTVVSRAPRPLYVNHPRTEPLAGDVARDADNDEARVWLYTGAPAGAKDRYSGWCFTTGHGSVAWTGRADVGYPQLATRLRLLVDGETGQVVPPELPADPLGHVRQGDPTPESANDESPCSAGANNFACTRERGHVGQHIAGTGVRNPVAAVWS